MSETTVKPITDAAERDSALDPQSSFIVQAPAGSGKTELLIQRFLSLLAAVEDPSEILAITFTRKAAGEMHYRVMDALRKAAAGAEGESPNERKTLTLARSALYNGDKRGWNLLENPTALKVQTIDSFSAMLARQMPVLSRMGLTPEITEDADELYNEAAMLTLAMAEDDGPVGEAVRTVCAHLDNSVAAFTERLTMMLSRRDQWLRHVRLGSDEAALRELVVGSLERIIADTLSGVREAFPAARTDALLSSAGYAASNLAAAGALSPVTALEAITGLPSSSPVDLLLWKGIAELLLTKTGELRKSGGVNVRTGFPADKHPEAKARKLAFQELLTNLDDEDIFIHRLKGVRVLPEPAYTEDEWKVLSALTRLLPAAVEHLMNVFARNGVVDFTALSTAALESLGTEDAPTDLLLALDMRIRHVLIDEYQDTSRTQLELVRALTSGWEPGDGRTLFIVGDPMQSIYLFREAEVGLFLQARTCGVGAVKLTPLTLRSNFRSQKRIVDWVNESFRDAFPDEEDIFTGSVTYELSEAVKGEIERLDPEVTCYRGRSDSREADDVTEIIRNIPQDETVAVLVRSRSHLTEIISRLKAAKIKFVSQDIDPLAESVVIGDLSSLLRAITHPLDRLSWLALLRAPWCGLTLTDIHALVSGTPGAAVWDLARDPERIRRLSADGAGRIEAIRGPIERALKLAGRVEPGRLLEGLWTELGGPACLKDESMMRDAEVFLSLVDELGRAWLFEGLDRLSARVEKLYSRPTRTDGGRAVELMTIHKAKGLEFDHVILPGMGKKPRSRDKELLLWVERGADLLLAPIEKKNGRSASPIYDYIREIHKEKEELEMTRLLYVAATRARKQLHVMAHTNGENATVASGSLFSSICHIADSASMVDTSAGEPAAADGVGEQQTVEDLLSRLPSGWVSPAASPPIYSAAEAVVKESETGTPEFKWAGPGVRHLGTVVHEYLCLIASTGLDSWDPERIRGEKDRIALKLRGMGLGASEAEGTSNTAVRVLTSALGSERGRWVLKDHREARVEAPLSGVVDGAVFHVIIDRTFVDENDDRWVIDYKTSLHEGGGTRAFLESEKERYRTQLEKYAAVLRAGGETRRIRMGLFYPAINEWVEWT